jgi:hypothetical protein
MKLNKCSFAQPELSYLGHIISDQGVATDPTKTTTMVEWPTPANQSELRGFLGLTGYYRKFIKHYGLIAKPLTNLLHKKQFSWSTIAQQAFDKLKAAMVSAPVLAIPDFEAPFLIEIDACDIGICAILMQGDQPIAFLSKALGPHHQRLSIYEKEFLALIMAVEKWRPYLQRQEFIIHTDHKSLSYLGEQVLHSEMQRKAMTRMMCRMDLPGSTTSVGTRTDYSVDPWDYPACATRHLMAWGTRTTEEKYSVRKLYMSCTVWKTPRRTRLVLSPYSDL